MRARVALIALANLAGLAACDLSQSDTVNARSAPPQGAVAVTPYDAALPAVPDAPGDEAAPEDFASPDVRKSPDLRLSTIGDAGSADADTRRQPCAGDFVFCDTFEHGAGSWMESGGSWTLIEGNDPSGPGEAYGPTIPVASEAYAPSFTWSDMTAEARVLVTSFGVASSTNRAELFARYQDSSHHYAIGVRSDGKVGLRKNGSTLGSAAAVSVAEYQWHTLKIRVAGVPGAVRVEGYLDGTLLVTATDTEADDGVAAGTVAIGVYGLTLAVFNDVRVSLP